MKKIGVISDTHGTLPPQAYTFFNECDEIWHAGDIGRNVLPQLSDYKPVRAVWGNADDYSLHYQYPKADIFECEGLRVYMTHIGGYPGHYSKDLLADLRLHKPDIFVCGHSHILKVMYDKDLDFLLINPGAAGRQGFHRVGTLVRFTIDGTPKDLEVLDFPKLQ